MTFVGGEKPSLDDLVHYGTKGMKWGVRNSNPTTSQIRDARARQQARVVNANLATARLNLAAESGTASQQKAAVKKFEKAHMDFALNEDRITAARMTKGEKVAAVLIGGPVGLVVLGVHKIAIKGAEKRIDTVRQKVSKKQ